MKNSELPHQVLVLVLVPEAWLKEVAEDLRFLKKHFNGKEMKHSLTDRISEKDAMALIGKKGTWFWKLRNSGELKFSKIGGKVYYAMADINELLERNKRSAA